MYQIDTAAGQVVASDTQDTVAAVDRAVMSLAHLCASIVEVSGASRLPVTAVQAALAETADGLAGLVGTRGHVGTATAELIAIQRQSNLRETAFGCPTGFPIPPQTAQRTEQAAA